jgi:hypothetical protein
MDKKAIAILIGSILLGLGGWVQTLTVWSAAITTGGISGLFLILGGIILNWLNQSPIKPTIPQ